MIVLKLQDRITHIIVSFTKALEASSYDVAQGRPYKILNKPQVRQVIFRIVVALDYLRREANLIHTCMCTYPILFNASIACISNLQSLAHFI